MKKAPAGAILPAVLGTAFAVSAYADAGASAAPFLRLGFGARALGLGEAFVAKADDASALYYNPAGIAALAPSKSGGRSELLLSHAIHFQDIRFSQAGFVRGFGPERALGLSVTYLTLDGIERRTSETAEPEGEFGASDLAVGLTYARSFGAASAGATAKLVRQQIAGRSASAVAADLGLVWRLSGLPVSFGASLANVGTDVKFVSEGHPLPATVRLGAAWGATKKLPASFGAQLDLARDTKPVGRFGVEYLGFGPLPLRAGYMLAGSSERNVLLGRDLGRQPTGLSQFFGLFMGFGFKASGWSLDYALLPYGELGSSHRLSMDLRF